MGQTEFVYVTYINTTPEQLWQALTDPAFTLRYWGIGLNRIGRRAPRCSGGRPRRGPRDLGQVVLESDPRRAPSPSWHHPRSYHAELFGWSAERLAEAKALTALEGDVRPRARRRDGQAHRDPRRLRARKPDARRRARQAGHRPSPTSRPSWRRATPCMQRRSAQRRALRSLRAEDPADAHRGRR